MTSITFYMYYGLRLSIQELVSSVQNLCTQVGQLYVGWKTWVGVELGYHHYEQGA